MRQVRGLQRPQHAILPAVWDSACESPRYGGWLRRGATTRARNCRTGARSTRSFAARHANAAPRDGSRGAFAAQSSASDCGRPKCSAVWCLRWRNSWRVFVLPAMRQAAGPSRSCRHTRASAGCSYAVSRTSRPCRGASTVSNANPKIRPNSGCHRASVGVPDFCESRWQ
jgi:hypothetical protein